MIPPLLVTESALAASTLALVVHYRVERRKLSRFANAAAHGAAPGLPAALQLAGAIFSGVAHGADPVFLCRPLEPLGATPMAVLRHGGCCSGLSRLYILALDVLGIQAAQVTLYHASGQAQHCLVEVTLQRERVLVDPMYGFYYRSPDGAPLGMDGLRSGCTPVFHAIPGSTCTSYPANDYYRFDYTATRTANWTATRTRRTAHRVLAAVTLGGIDTWRVPAALEWPQLILASALAPLGAGMGITACT